MRVLHLTAPAAFGGLESVVAGLARGTARAGHEVTVAMTLVPGTGEPAWGSALRADGVSVEAIMLPGRAYLRERRAVRDLIARVRPDVVHTHGYRSDVLHAGSARRAGAGVVSTAHGFASTDRLGKLYERLQLRVWRHFDAVVAVSDPLHAAMVAAGVSPSKLERIANGLVTGGAAPLSREEARRRLGIVRSGPVIGWVGRFSEEKDPELMVRAFAGLASTAATLCMVGDGPQHARIRALTHELGVQASVVLTGPVEGASTCFRAFDLLALSSRTEGTPMVLLEAAHAAVPIVATAVGGVPALLGAGGRLVPPGNVGALTEALRADLDDPGAATKRAESLRERLGAKPDEGDWVARYLALYERIRRQVR